MTAEEISAEYMNAHQNWIDSLMTFHHEEETSCTKRLHADRVTETRKMSSKGKRAIPAMKDADGKLITSAEGKADLLNHAFIEATKVPADFPQNLGARKEVIPDVNQNLSHVEFSLADGTSRFKPCADPKQAQ